MSNINDQRTIFVTIGGGLMARNISTSGVLDRLIKTYHCKIVVFMENVRNLKPPDDILHGVGGEDLEVIIVPRHVFSFVEKVFFNLVIDLPFTISTKIKLRFHPQKEKRKTGMTYFLYWIVYTPLSKSRTLKKVLRKVDALVFRSNTFEDYFERYKPRAIFATSIISTGIDTQLLKEAQRRGIKTIAMTKSWDNLDKAFFRVEPDIFLVQGEAMREPVAKYQAIPVEKIKAVGFPQFDMYNDSSLLISKEDYCARKNFDPKFPVLFLGSEGLWTFLTDIEVFKAIIQARNTGRIPWCNILIRPHFSALDEIDFSELGKEKKVFIDDTFHREPFFNDKWNQTYDDMIDFMNSLHHMDIMIMLASTLTLDAACFDKPTIGVAYGAMFFEGKDVSAIRYDTTHYKWVTDLDAVKIVRSEDALMDAIIHALKHPEDRAEGRRKMLDAICDGANGQSIDKIARTIASGLNG